MTRSLRKCANLGFDSILVRLKVGQSSSGKSAITGFRFHTGSIKSSDNILPCLLHGSFDSILVRLKDPSDTPTSNPTPGFDSILVRLKVQLGDKLQGVFTCFDSILVRLKAIRDCESCITASLERTFRFHTGSIKRKS